MKKYRAKGKCLTLASVAQGLEHCPHNQNIVGSIPSQDTYLGCRSSLVLGQVPASPGSDM